MPVAGSEIASLDFANLIGGPLDAIIRAQAKSAISTANFIKEVGFDADGKLINVDFTYTKKNEKNKNQEFTLSVPFLCMLPIPYISIYDAVIDFNAKITSTTTTDLSEESSAEGEFSASAKYWFFSASVTGKTSSQKKSSYSDSEERMFEMHVRVQAQNQDMPTGTDRILTMLEDAIGEKRGPKVLTFKVTDTVPSQLGTAGPVTALETDADPELLKKIKAGWVFHLKDLEGKPLEFKLKDYASASPKQVLLEGTYPSSDKLKYLVGRTIEIAMPEN